MRATRPTTAASHQRPSPSPKARPKPELTVDLANWLASCNWKRRLLTPFKKDSVAVCQKLKRSAQLMGKDAKWKLADNEQHRGLMKVKRLNEAVMRSPFEAEKMPSTASTPTITCTRRCVRSARTVSQFLKTREMQENANSKHRDEIVDEIGWMRNLMNVAVSLQSLYRFSWQCHQGLACKKLMKS